MAQVLLNGESRFLSPCDFKELGVAKRSRSTTSARSALRQPWRIIARTKFWKAATNLKVVRPKLFQGSRQDDLRLHGCPSFKFLTMEMLPSVSWARIWTVLSATI